MASETTSRTRERRGHGGGGGLPTDALGLVTINTGLLVEDLPFAGMTIGEIRRRFGADRLDIDANAVATVNGEQVRRADEDAVRVRPGQVLGFIRPTGEKGGRYV